MVLRGRPRSGAAKEDGVKPHRGKGRKKEPFQGAMNLRKKKSDKMIDAGGGRSFAKRGKSGYRRRRNARDLGEKVVPFRIPRRSVGKKRRTVRKRGRGNIDRKEKRVLSDGKEGSIRSRARVGGKVRLLRKRGNTFSYSRGSVV